MSWEPPAAGHGRSKDCNARLLGCETMGLGVKQTNVSTPGLPLTRYGSSKDHITLSFSSLSLTMGLKNQLQSLVHQDEHVTEREAHSE